MKLKSAVFEIEPWRVCGRVPGDPITYDFLASRIVVEDDSVTMVGQVIENRVWLEVDEKYRAAKGVDIEFVPGFVTADLLPNDMLSMCRKVQAWTSQAIAREATT